METIRKGTDLVRKQNLQATLDSREVAEMLGKEHSELLKEIEGRKDGKNVGLIPTLEKGNFHLSNYFIPDTYKSGTRDYKCYQITKMGCELIGNKQQGEKGILFTAKYVERFNKMEKAIDPLANISPELKSILMLDKKTLEIDNRVTKLENTMTIDYAQQEELNSLARKVVVQALGGKDAPAYKELNKKAFSQMWKDYKRILGVNSYKNTAVKDLDFARKVLLDWKAPRELELMIKGANSQLRM